MTPEILNKSYDECQTYKMLHSQKRLDGGTRKMVVVSNFVEL